MSISTNPELNIGDRVICYHMEGETSVPPGTEGTVSHVGNDPFDAEGKLISVKWDNGSTLSLVSETDVWKKAKAKIAEAKATTHDKIANYFIDNPDIFENFDWKFLRNYLYKIRESSIVNMFTAAPLLYCGEKHLDRYYGEHPSNPEAFNEVLEMADEAKDKMIQGTMGYMESKGIDIDLEDMSQFNSTIRRMSQKILDLYVTFADA